MENEKVIIEVGNDKMAVLSIQPFDGDVDVESILKIDYSNMIGEVITFPVVFNRIANLRAEMTNIVAEAKLTFEIFEANLYEKHKKHILATEGKATEKATESAVLKDPEYAIGKRIYLRALRDFEYVESLYWSAQSKDRKLNVLIEKISPEEFEKELVEGAINGVLIKMKQQVIKTPKK